MKVVHLCNLPVPKEHPDYEKVACHPGRWVLNLAIAQRTHTGIEPELVVQIPGAARDYTKVIEGIPVHFLAAPNRFRAATLFYFDARRLAAGVLALRPDVVHAHGTEDAYALAALRTKAPCVVTFQGVFRLMNRLLPPSALSRAHVQEFCEGIAVRRLRYAIVKSAYGRSAISAEFPHLQLFSIPNTYIPPQVKPVFDKPNRDVVFAGTIVPRKGVHTLAAAIAGIAARQPDMRLILFGNPHTESEYGAAQVARLREILGDRLLVRGLVSNADLTRGMADARVLVAPSIEEMFGNQVIEALLLGTHVIVTDGTPMAENVRRFGNGDIVPQNDPQRLADAIEMVLQADKFPDAEAALSRIENYMGPKVVADQHYQAYQEVIGGWN